VSRLGAQDVPPADSRITGAGGAARLRIDSVACDGIGMCAHLAPGIIALDMWGYPILPDDTLERRDLQAARTAVAGCPKKALFLAP
jgi:ferredoxin